MTALVEPFAPWLRDSNRFVDSETRVTRFVPAADVLVTDDGATVHMDVPGVERDALEIELENDVLTVRGERPYPYGDNPVPSAPRARIRPLRADPARVARSRSERDRGVDEQRRADAPPAQARVAQAAQDRDPRRSTARGRRLRMRPVDAAAGSVVAAPPDGGSDGYPAALFPRSLTPVRWRSAAAPWRPRQRRRPTTPSTTAPIARHP